LNFLEKVKLFSDKFYQKVIIFNIFRVSFNVLMFFFCINFKYKMIASKKKMKKDDGLIVKTVRDNLKAFVDYKIQKSK